MFDVKQEFDLHMNEYIEQDFFDQNEQNILNIHNEILHSNLLFDQSKV